MARATPQEGTPAIQGNLHVPEDCRAVSRGPGAVGQVDGVGLDPGRQAAIQNVVANLMRGVRRISVEYRNQLRRDAFIAGAPEYELARFSAEQHREQSKIDCMKSK